MRREFYSLTTFIVQPAGPSDRADWLAMRIALWPDEDAGELGREIDLFLDPAITEYGWIARSADGRRAGFIEASLRSYAEGCWPGPTPYIEGLWVEAQFRRLGVAAQMLGAVEDWARASGHHEIGSDALLDNGVSHAWHAARGFDEVERIIVFRKAL